MLTFIFSFFFACGEKTTDTAESITTDTAEETTEENTEETTDSNNIGDMGEYVSAYCTSYALRCGVYGTQESCENDVAAWYNSTCSIIDTDALNTCVDWLSEFSCEDIGWIDECDQFYTCD